MRHDRCGDWARGLRRGEQLIPLLHDRNQGIQSQVRGTSHEPTDHLSTPPVETRERHPHHLQSQFKGHRQQNLTPGTCVRCRVSKGILRQLEGKEIKLILCPQLHVLSSSSP